MDAKAILENLLATGKQYAAQGKNLAEEKLNIPQEGPEREAMVSGMGKGALAAGALALLFGTGAGRRLTGSALKVGSLAAIGGLAYKTYQNWQNQQQTPKNPGTPVNELSGAAAEDRSIGLIKAMIAAAKADGHIDDQERARINEQMQKMQLDAGTLAFLKAEVDKPLDVTDVARHADSPESAAEIYLASVMVIDIDQPAEREYLSVLAKELDLDAALAMDLERQVKTL
ncbi:tellurite resistance TerB family protein [Granulosicoccaceae sp. 1_MG-2023]|nr:tellurite resistance TerB family protein [Granulosicoccaceae sp. 1_MG-2023]